MPNHPGFIEGIDIPSAKPRPNLQVDLPRTALKTVQPSDVCKIEGAFIEPTRTELDRRETNSDPGCGIENPVDLTGLQQGQATVSFAASVTVSCDFARALTDWLQLNVLPEARVLFGRPVTLITSGPGYQCRRRNNLPDGKLSEHALGKAIDLTFFQLSDGTKISVEADWGKETVNGRFLAAIHASACKRFATVLGPEADPNHKSHIHLDAGCHGKDCTHIICQ
jgi:hypothetical protein